MRQFIIAILLIVLFSACDNDIDVSADYKTIPIVYAFIDTERDTNFIRIEKAFLGEGQNANDVAQDPDSLYFDDIEVSITKSNGTKIVIDRIDGNTIGRPRDAGTFAETPNYLYFFTQNDISLRADDRVTLEILQNENELAQASTPMIAEAQLTSPFDEDFPIPFIEGTDTRIGYRFSTSTGMYGIRIRFSFLEENDQGVFVEKSVLWNILDNGVVTDGAERGSYSVEGGDFFRFLAAELGGDPSNRRRVSQSLDLELIAVGKELRSIRDIQLANQGVTGSQELPVYTNVDNGRGIFSAKSSYIERNIGLSTRTIDSLVNGRITADLNFIN